MGLKRLLDERAGGLIDFFLSSDDDSIAHGTIWPEEVRNALDCMTLMLIFVSSEALKSGWTYFEAGYGLHKLGSAKIYCLPGTNKGSLPSPFNILQNRNLYSPRDISLLIKQCNEELSASLKENVSQQEFDRIFKKPLILQLETTPSFERLVKRVSLSVQGPVNSAEILSKVCNKKGFAVSPNTSRQRWSNVEDAFITTGVRLDILSPDLEELREEISISPEALRVGNMRLRKNSADSWDESYSGEETSLSDIRKYNARIRKINEEINQKNEAAKKGPRYCCFEFAPNNISVPIEIIDDWIIAVKIEEPIQLKIRLNEEVEVEPRVELITAKIHGSELSLNTDGSYLWRNKVALNLQWNVGQDHRDNDLELNPYNGERLLIGDLFLQELISSLFQLKVISLPSYRSGGRRK